MGQTMPMTSSQISNINPYSRNSYSSQPSNSYAGYMPYADTLRPQQQPSNGRYSSPVYTSPYNSYYSGQQQPQQQGLYSASMYNPYSGSSQLNTIYGSMRTIPYATSNTQQAGYGSLYSNAINPYASIGGTSSGILGNSAVVQAAALGAQIRNLIVVLLNLTAVYRQLQKHVYKLAMYARGWLGWALWAQHQLA
uniref:Uncharacterized protein n=1 Tax=Ditylenchus dipsaci TaxID=166011 RepID=A0A915D9H4_9BILA